jgi:hypothetical protein
MHTFSFPANVLDSCIRPIRFQNFLTLAINLCNDSTVEGGIRHADLPYRAVPVRRPHLRSGPFCNLEADRWRAASEGLSTMEPNAPE